METQVESLKSTREIVQSAHIHRHFNEQKGYLGPTHAWLYACIHPTKGDTDGEKFVKPMIRLFVPGCVMLGSQGRGVRSQGFDFCWSKELSSVTTASAQ